MKQSERELYKNAVQHFGFKAQMDMLAEEASELAVSALHMTREYKNSSQEERYKCINSLIDEIADIQVMTECMSQYLGIEVSVAAQREKKLERLKNLILEGAKH